MKTSSFGGIARKTALALGIAAVFAATGGCRPDNDVAPGAPILTQFLIIEPGPSPYAITAATTDCAAAVATGEACNPQLETICRLPTGDSWCRCLGSSYCPEFAPPSDMGQWTCEPFAPGTAVIANFDRLLDPNAFTPDDAGVSPPAATIEVTPAPPSAVGIATDYASNGIAQFGTGANAGLLVGSLVIPLYARCLWGNLRGEGPSLLLLPEPAMPAGSTVTIALDGTRVRAKDGHTQFTGSGLLQDGRLVLQTAAFSASIGLPDPAMMTDTDPIVVSFNSPVDPATIVSHVTVTGAPASIESDGLSVTITPDPAWPVSTAITVTVDATAADVLGSTLGTAVMDTLMTPDMFAPPPAM